MSNSSETIDDVTFEARARAAGATVLVSFGAAWCGPCRAFSPVLDELRRRDGVETLEVDIEEAPIAARRYAIRAAPTIVVFRDGEPIARHVGLATRATLLALLRG